MIKKIGLLAITASLSFASTNIEVINFLKKQIPPQILKTLDIKVLKIDKIPNSNMEAIILQIKSPKRTDKITFFTDGQFIMKDIIDLKSGKSYAKKLQEKELKIALKSEKSENFVYIGDKNKPLITIFSDPECPYCRKEVAKLGKMLETNSVRMIFTPVHRRTSLAKSHLIYKITKTQKTDAQKVATIQKYFDKNVKMDVNVTDKEVKVIEDLRKKYFSMGLKGVPFIIKESNEKKVAKIENNQDVRIIKAKPE